MANSFEFDFISGLAGGEELKSKLAASSKSGWNVVNMAVYGQGMAIILLQRQLNENGMGSVTM